MSDQRLIDLEIKISHQEHAIETLQQLAYEQHKVIEKLEAKLDALTKRFDGASEGGPDIGPANEKPPHY